ncbi:MAG: hypothetical protein GY791_08065 [Alphaproteobacteria bacterium]|nr:hypothetical protein [Alphaproteobacteria bacterium]
MRSGAWKVWAACAVVLIVIAVGLAVITPTREKRDGPFKHPATVEAIDGSNLNRITLTEKAAQRLRIETAPVREDTVVRWRVIRGEVVSIGDDVFESVADDSSDADDVTDPALPIGEVQVAMSGPIEIRVPRHRDLNSLGAEQLAEVLIELDDDDDDDDEATEIEAELVDDEDDSDVDEDAEWLTYLITSRQKADRLSLGQEIRVRVPLVSRDARQKVVPYGAVIYDPHGNTWVYTNPEPFVFVRDKVVVDFIEGDVAVLKEGPDIGTEVLTVGTVEVYGTEFKVGH